MISSNHKLALLKGAGFRIYTVLEMQNASFGVTDTISVFSPLKKPVLAQCCIGNAKCLILDVQSYGQRYHGEKGFDFVSKKEAEKTRVEMLRMNARNQSNSKRGKRGGGHTH